MGDERGKDAGDKARGAPDDKSSKAALDQSQQVRGQPDKAGNPKRVDRTPVDEEGSVDDE
jgi:hypothetical protein